MALLERDELIGRLWAAAADARDGNGAVVLVSGEAGAGKTALVRAGTKDAVWGYCEPLTTPRPLGPFRDIETQLWPAGGRLEPLAVADRLLRQLSAPGPALVVEDAHWIDTSSAEVLRFVGRRIAPSCGLVVIIARDEPSPVLRSVLGDLADAVVRLEVPALSPAAVAALVASTGVDAAEAVRLTGGNAFLVSQLASTQSQLRDSVAARLARLSAPARELAELLCVVPGRIPPALAGSGWAQVDELVAVGLLQVRAQDVEFRHELVRLALENSLAPGRRAELNGRVLDLLTAESGAEPVAEPAQVAHHARLANRPELAFEAETAAALRASALGSHHEAVAHLERAVVLADHLAPVERRARLRLFAAEEQLAIAAETDAGRSAREAMRLGGTVDDVLLQSTAARVLSRIEPDEVTAHELASTAVQLAEPRGRTVELAAGYAQLASDRMLARDLGAAIDTAAKASELARQVGDVGSEVVAANALGSALLLTGDAAGQMHLRRALHLAAANGIDAETGRAYANLVSGSGEARLYELSAAASREALRFFTARDLDAMGRYTLAWRARCLFEQSHWDDASEQLDRLVENPERNGATTQLICHYVRARLIARRDGANPYPELDAADALAGPMRSLQRVAPAAAARAETDWLHGAAGDRDTLHRIYELALTRDIPWTIGELGFWLWRFGELVELPSTAAAPFALHVAGDLDAAADAWLALGCRYEAAEAWADGTDEAQLRRALGVFAELHAVPAWQRTARRLRKLGARSVPRGPRSSTAAHPSGLTVREAEVLQWLAQGRTDGEIAARLHLSVRTVEHHVAAVLRKTGAASRRDLLTR